MPAILSLPVPGLHSLPDFSPALTRHGLLTNTIPLPPRFLINNLLTLTTYLLTLSTQGNFFSPRKSSSYSPSLRVLYARLCAGYTAPSPLPAAFLTPAHTAQCTYANTVVCDVRERPLADFQDLYYALLARIREMQQRMSDHLRSGFSVPTTAIFLCGPTLAELHTSLSGHWDLLNEAAAGKAMDDAVREARVQCIQDEIVEQVANNMLGAEEAELQIMQLREKSVYEAQAGLEWTPEWDAALVNAKLAEKYRVCFEECRRRDKKEGGRGKALQRQETDFGKGLVGGDTARADEEARDEVSGVGECGEDRFIEKEELELDRREQEWLWQVSQLQHPAYRNGSSISVQDQLSSELSRANTSQIGYVSSIESKEAIHVAPSVQRYHQQTRLDGPALVTQQEQIDYEQIVFSEDCLAWRRELNSQRQRVSEYSAYLRSCASLQARSMVAQPWHENGYQGSP